MAVPAYWNTGFKKSSTPSFTDVADWIVEIRTMLTSTLDVADRWVESPAGTFTSPADSISGNQIVMALSAASTTRLQAAISQIVNGVTTVVGTQGFEANVSGAPVTASIMAGPKHFWTQVDVASGEFIGLAMAEPAPEAASGMSAAVIAKASRNNGGAGYTTNADYWHGIVDSLATDSLRALGPLFIAAAASQEMKTAGGSFVYFPVAACSWPITTLPAFIGNLYQFVWVDQGFVAGNFVTVPIDVGVVGVFQVVSAACTPACNGRGANLAVRVA